MDEQDPAEEMFGKAMKTALAAAAIGGRQVAQQIQQMQQEREARDLAAAREAQVRYEAAARQAEAVLGAFQPNETMTADMVAQAYSYSRAWAEVDRDRFGPHVDRIGDAIRTRYGIDPEAAASEAALRNEADVAKSHGAEHRDQAALDEAAALVVGVDTVDELRDHANEHKADAEHDESVADHLDAKANIEARLAGAGVDEATSAPRVTAADLQAKPAKAATGRSKVRARSRSNRPQIARTADRGR